MNRVLFKKLTGSQLFKKFTLFYASRIHKTSSSIPLLSQINPAHDPILHLEDPF